jgi:hypothetical protein
MPDDERGRIYSLIDDLKARHTQQSWPDGNGNNCAECTGRRWPCPTRQSLDRISDELTHRTVMHRVFHGTTNGLPDGPRCVECSKTWPCPTIQILDRTLT